jgi:hypothetical protein
MKIAREVSGHEVLKRKSPMPASFALNGLFQAERNE